MRLVPPFLQPAEHDQTRPPRTLRRTTYRTSGPLSSREADGTSPCGAVDACRGLLEVHLREQSRLVRILQIRVHFVDGCIEEVDRRRRDVERGGDNTWHDTVEERLVLV